ncbi:MAG: O-succinylbenzoic acid--CoA ligase, partial [Bacteroidales bacterium]|nr:O-succinylbenzoic acid--CoA ligase [Bacteroidales bacterium]
PAASFSTLPGVQISTDERGCLVVEVPGVTDGPVITNDMVEITAEGAFAWQGPIDHVINSGGIKINPEILEERIHSITGLEVVIISLPDETLGNRLLLVAECTEAELPGGLREMLAGKFQKHEVPRNIITLPEFPRNRSMKIDREAIRRAVNPL